jgi:branched-chain amino acid aminotransferase
MRDAWIDGELMGASEATVPLLSHALHYGTAVFEGVRIYETDEGPAFFRLDDHLDRLMASADLYQLEVPYTPAELRRAAAELVIASGLTECYLRPIVFPAEGTMAVSPQGARVSTAMAVWEWGPYLGADGKRQGIRAMVSSWRRLSASSVIPAAKASAHYVNSGLAKLEAQRAGYEEAILLDCRGMVSEGSGENIFLVNDGVVSTPSPLSSILDGITRRSVVEIAFDRGMTVLERDISRHELYLADEVFLTGTAAELTPVREVDGRQVGNGTPGPVTVELGRLLDEAFRGCLPRFSNWSQPVGELAAKTTSS